MSRNCKYVLLGVLWTATTVFFFTGNLLNLALDGSAAGLLALALTPPIALFALAGVTDSAAARWSAVILHLLVPFLWLSQIAGTAGVYINSAAFFWISFTTLVGCTVSDLALNLDVTELSSIDFYFDEEKERRRAQAAVKACGVFDSNGSFDSGGFGPLLAYESGAFKSL